MFTLKTPKQNVVHRLKICKGHLRAVERELENEQDCLKVVHQLQAIQHAVQQVELLIIQDFLVKNSQSPELLLKALRQVASSSLHLSPSRIHQYQEKRSIV